MWKNLENFSKSIQILVSGSEVWTCNLMITSLVSYPLDHRGKLEKFAVYVSFIKKIWKYPFLANEIYNPQTHFGFTNLWSNMPRYWVASSRKVKNGTRTPCNIFMRFSFPYESTHLGFFTIFETHFNALCTCSCTISDSEMHPDKLLNKLKNNQK